MSGEVATGGPVTLADLTWPDAGRLAGPDVVLAVPLGSTEQHGPHLPLSTDTDIAVALCRRLAAGRPQVVVAPAVAYGASGEHAGFPGTLSIGQAALELLLVELGRSVSESFGALLFVSGHGGNAEPAARAVRRLRAEGRRVELFLAAGRGDAHAGVSETSMMLALEPGRVQMAKAVPGDLRPLPEIWPLLRSQGVRAVSASGVLGDPTGANASAGAALLDQMTTDLTLKLDRLTDPQRR